MKRLIIATLGGVVCGGICLSFVFSGGEEVASPVIWQILFSRTLIGFAIGISCLKLVHWSIHGLVLGFLFSLPLAFSGLMAPDNPEFSKNMMFFSTVILGAIYGLLIEVITTAVFKAKME
ncbi:MAG: hypothetical protein H8E14_01640 [Candidatus Marinimicrobia bacterium]|nr:hypothetical protein [Candidatus Neomarinimicrobiota bacterium]